MTNMIKQKLGITLFLTFILAGLQAEAAKIQTTDGRVIPATNIRFKKTTQEYIVTMANGTEIPVPKNRVKMVEVDKPAQFDRAASAVSTGALDQAIPMLEEIAQGFFMLSPWEGKTLDLLGYAYGRKGDTKKAADAYKKLLANVPPVEITTDMQRRVWNAFIAVNDNASLSQSVDAAIAKGGRENAAAAHIARADMAKVQGNKTDALLDYMRVVILYEQIKSLQPEALYKTAKCLEELRDPRAEDFRKRLLQDWPQSEWASKK
ncbi:MAG: tetratricopeptide repeat protein [Kiritimatiellae bacterium]|nr:tetratricopeptide repeat protein [Kiritimatiellia bacterium]MDD5519177.1 tetratricopeptide repeat protein [Kiritimatiellia bacterium]